MVKFNVYNELLNVVTYIDVINWSLYSIYSKKKFFIDVVANSYSNKHTKEGGMWCTKFE
jgi:hypothetical protein